MLAKVQTAQTSHHTVEEIDGYLSSISNGLEHGSIPNRKLAMKRADKWLDLRLEAAKRNA
jgi:hypothetical protein